MNFELMSNPQISNSVALYLVLVSGLTLLIVLSIIHLFPSLLRTTMPIQNQRVLNTLLQGQPGGHMVMRFENPDASIAMHQDREMVEVRFTSMDSRGRTRSYEFLYEIDDRQARPTRGHQAARGGRGRARGAFRHQPNLDHQRQRDLDQARRERERVQAFNAEIERQRQDNRRFNARQNARREPRGAAPPDHAQQQRRRNEQEAQRIIEEIRDQVAAAARANNDNTPRLAAMYDRDQRNRTRAQRERSASPRRRQPAAATSSEAPPRRLPSEILAQFILSPPGLAKIVPGSDLKCPSQGNMKEPIGKPGGMLE